MEHRLIITIDYEAAPRAIDLGELFVALARDYKDFTKGRALVVASIEQGSIITTLADWAAQAIPYVKDAVEFAKGAKALADFGKILKEWIEGANTGKRKLIRSRGRKPPGQRSVEAIIKVAADSGCAVRVKHTSPDGETFEVEMSRPQATILHEEWLARESGAVDSKEVLRVQGAKVALPDLKEAIDRLYQPGIEFSSSDIDTIIDALVRALEATHLTHLIPAIVADLSNQGRHAMASALQAHAHRSDGKDEPPLATA
jgi:hypothetical protein